MIEKGITISMVRQCEMLGIHRSGLYYQPIAESEENLGIMRQMDEFYLEAPFYGIRRVRNWLMEQGYVIAKSRVKRLMNLMGWQTLFPKKNTSKRNKAHAIYPYLLKGLEINRANQVWAIDITYVPMRKGFMYLCAVIDVHTRFVVNWSISNNMTSAWCRSIVEEAITNYGCPEIINSDQGSQFTGDEYISLLKESKIDISMDGKGRAIDNIFIERLWRSVKYECVYLHAFNDGVELYHGLNKYFEFYNNKRGHQSHHYKTPASIYKAAA